MSRIGKKIITLPEKTEVTASRGRVVVKGPKGTLEKTFSSNISVAIAGREVTITPLSGVDDLEALWGASTANFANMVKGVNETFAKKLIIEGIGYKAEIKGADLILSLGFSHPVKVAIPSTLKVSVDPKANSIFISGVDKDEVGHFAAKIRDLKKPEPYKGKGIHYENEVVRRKQGKKSV